MELILTKEEVREYAAGTVEKDAIVGYRSRDALGDACLKFSPIPIFLDYPVGYSDNILSVGTEKAVGMVNSVRLLDNGTVMCDATFHSDIDIDGIRLGVGTTCVAGMLGGEFEGIKYDRTFSDIKFKMAEIKKG